MTACTVVMFNEEDTILFFLSPPFPLAFYIALCQYVDMVCIYCGSKTQVTNSRLQKRLNHTWRRRECTKCHAVFTTEEVPDLSGSIVVKHRQSPTQPFSRDKLFASVLRAVGHRKHPIDDAGALTATIIAKLARADAKASIEPTDIVQATLETLRHFDQAAAVQYAAYHRG